MIIRAEGHVVTVTVGDQQLELSFPEANTLQAELRQLLIDNAVTLRDIL